MDIPRLLISATSGGSGKTFITTGIIAALRSRAISAAPFKKGPDFIDCKWLGLAAGRNCFNLDVFLFEDQIERSFFSHIENADIAIIEGNHGLYDSIDKEGKGSSAFLARKLKTPVILIVSCGKLSRSVAAIINGFVHFEQDTRIAGVILNQVSGKRHEEKLTEAITLHCNVPILGVVHKTDSVQLEQRHLGIITTEDKTQVDETIEGLKKIVETSVDLDKIMKIARDAPSLSGTFLPGKRKVVSGQSIRIAMAKDSAFNFYYPDNLQSLVDAGAEIIEFSPILDKNLPNADAIYIGGGYPELYCDPLEKNYPMREQIQRAIESGLPAYAECGGLMYLSHKITWAEESHQMVGAFQGDTVMTKTPQGRGYVELESTGVSTPGTLWRIPAGETIRAHEFHYSRLDNLKEDSIFAFHMNRGTGISRQQDGLLYKNLLALYTHIHALSAPWWADSFVDVARRFKAKKESGII